MGILRYGQEYNQLAFQNRFNTPWFIAGNGGICGLWISPLRENRPSNWDKCGFGHLSVRTNPNQSEFRIETRVVLFEVKTLFLFPNTLPGNEFRLELDLVDWVKLPSVDFGTVLLEPESGNDLAEVLDSLQLVVTIVQALL